MERTASRQAGPDATDRILCYCLNITDADVVDAIMRLNVCTLAELRRETGAGDGCTACHHRLRRCLAAHTSGVTPGDPAPAYPICSVK